MILSVPVSISNEPTYFERRIWCLNFCWPGFNEFAVMRCDYMLVSQALAQYAASYQVIKNSVTDVASDHNPLFATFEMPK
jgi:endonuclease/exonuclease/phosphatase family metal-dependent hydrolase